MPQETAFAAVAAFTASTKPALVFGATSTSSFAARPVAAASIGT